MNLPNSDLPNQDLSNQTDKEVILTDEESPSGISRRSFFKRAVITGATSAIALGGFVSLASVLEKEARGANVKAKATPNGATRGDLDILFAAEIAEALAVTTYSNIINTAPFFTRIPEDDQGYLQGALQEEMSHYLLEQSVTNAPTPYKSFYYPFNMFSDAQTTLNTLVTLEDAFIGAYLVGVRDFSSEPLRLTAARIMGIESDHRTLARVIGPDVAPQDGGPITMITGFQGVPENVAPPNNNGYERTLCFGRIQEVATALLPFVSLTAAQQAGFDTSKTFPFQPFTPTLPNPLGDFISFTGC
jgi:hypothetical protein